MNTREEVEATLRSDNRTIDGHPPGHPLYEEKMAAWVEVKHAADAKLAEEQAITLDRARQRAELKALANDIATGTGTIAERMRRVEKVLASLLVHELKN